MKKAIAVTLCLLCIAALCIFALGFTVQPSAYITDDFSVSEDGSEITFRVGVGASMGYIRTYRDEGGGNEPHYLKFYSAWGGFNSSLGAKSEFTLPLSPDDTEIHVYHGDAGYDLALQKDPASGEWYRVH